MGSFIARRLLAMVPLLLIITFAVYGLVLIVPGDPARTLAGGFKADPAEVVRIRHALHLDQPFVNQYWRWLTHALRGDLGQSLFQNESVAHGIATRLPPTLSLALGGLVVSVLIGLSLGIFAGTRPGTAVDRAATTASSVGIAMPDFWVAIILLVVLAVKAHILPALGYVKFGTSPWQWARHLLMPWLALGLAGGATLARFIRSSLIDTLDQEYVRTARAMGIRERRVIGQLALKNALTPALTILGIQFAYTLGGTVILEGIFSINGLGGYILSAIDKKDLPIVQGVVLFIALVFVVVNLLVDLLYGVLNPKVRVS